MTYKETALLSKRQIISLPGHRNGKAGQSLIAIFLLTWMFIPLTQLPLEFLDWDLVGKAYVVRRWTNVTGIVIFLEDSTPFKLFKQWRWLSFYYAHSYKSLRGDLLILLQQNHEKILNISLIY